MLISKEKNIKDEVCPECLTGKAVVKFRAPKRYFWGCSFFPDCYGPKAWQSIQVPEKQRRECDEMFKQSQKALEEAEVTREKKRDAPLEPGEEVCDKDDKDIEGKHDVLDGSEVAGTKKRK